MLLLPVSGAALVGIVHDPAGRWATVAVARTSDDRSQRRTMTEHQAPATAYERGERDEVELMYELDELRRQQKTRFGKCIGEPATCSPAMRAGKCTPRIPNRPGAVDAEAGKTNPNARTTKPISAEQREQHRRAAVNDEQIPDRELKTGSRMADSTIPRFNLNTYNTTRGTRAFTRTCRSILQCTWRALLGDDERTRSARPTLREWKPGAAVSGLAADEIGVWVVELDAGLSSQAEIDGAEPGEELAVLDADERVRAARFVRAGTAGGSPGVGAPCERFWAACSASSRPRSGSGHVRTRQA